MASSPSADNVKSVPQLIAERPEVDTTAIYR